MDRASASGKFTEEVPPPPPRGGGLSLTSSKQKIPGSTPGMVKRGRSRLTAGFPFCFVLFCFVLFCFVLFCFVLFLCLLPSSRPSSLPSPPPPRTSAEVRGGLLWVSFAFSFLLGCTTYLLAVFSFLSFSARPRSRGEPARSGALRRPTLLRLRETLPAVITCVGATAAPPAPRGFTCPAWQPAQTTAAGARRGSRAAPGSPGAEGRSETERSRGRV